MGVSSPAPLSARNTDTQHCAEYPDALVGVDGIQRFAYPNPEKSHVVARISSSERLSLGGAIHYWKYVPKCSDIQPESIHYWKYEPRTVFFLDSEVGVR